MNTQLDKYDELAGVLSSLGPDIDEAEVIDSINAALNCKRDKKLHVLAVIVGLHCGFESLMPCEACGKGRERIKDAILKIGTDGNDWPEIIE